jgi:fructokinase
MVPVIFGEVLIDVFPDGKELLGGAPFNVAWHLRGLGLRPLLATCVGEDRRGRRILERMEGFGLTTEAVQRASCLPTGTVQVLFREGSPEFRVAPTGAHDRIDPEAALKVLRGKSVSLLYNGTLALRAQDSRRALATLAERFPQAIRFVDLNLRPPWHNPEIIEEQLRATDWLKLNRSELETIRPGGGKLVEKARKLVRRYGLDGLIVTLAEEGACLVTGEEELQEAAPSVSRPGDEVGAGDGFSAVWICGLLLKWPRPLIMERALQFAAAVCEIKGAVSKERSWYDVFRREWAL